jgi:hypothetical protein
MSIVLSFDDDVATLMLQLDCGVRPVVLVQEEVRAIISDQFRPFRAIYARRVHFLQMSSRVFLLPTLQYSAT